MPIDGLTGHASIGEGMDVTIGMRWIYLLAALALILIALLALAWNAGGDETVHEIAQPVAVPEIAS